jgi:glycyl-tRNA synthetase beta chain
MRTHQKYFSCLNPEPAPAKAGGPLAPRFLFVANNLTPDDGRTIVAGNERVLRARLADARFFWDQDRKVRLEDRADALENRIFHAELGTMLQKIRRMERLVEFLVDRVPGAVFHLSLRAVRLAKADLSTGMVGEFPELQGVIGRYYALQGDENPRVADAIADHYKPLGPNDSCPSAPDTVVVALADKLDSLAAFFSIGETPTGSRDPFALRRAAQGVIRLVLENKLRIPLLQAFHRVAEALGDRYSDEAGNATLFILDRLKVHLRESGVRHDFINAVRFPPGVACEDDLVRLLARVNALTKFLKTEDGSNLLIAYRRASNIVAIEAKKGGWTDGAVDSNLLHLPEELSLADRLLEADALTGDPLLSERFDEAMLILASLRRPVDEFFDKVTVNAEDPALRENRLRLLSRIRAVMNQVADFSQIEG